jgi:hypothetical protein
MNTRIDLSLTGESFTPRLIEADGDDHPEWAGEVAAALVCLHASDRVEISFNLGWEDPAVVLANIDRFAAALAALREQVAAMPALPLVDEPADVDEAVPA